MSIVDAINLNLNKICRACLLHNDNMNELNGVVESAQMSLGDLLLACSKVSNWSWGFDCERIKEAK